MARRKVCSEPAPTVGIMGELPSVDVLRDRAQSLRDELARVEAVLEVVQRIHGCRCEQYECPVIPVEDDLT